MYLPQLKTWKMIRSYKRILCGNKVKKSYSSLNVAKKQTGYLVSSSVKFFRCCTVDYGVSEDKLKLS